MVVIHPSAITVDDEDNQVLTQENFSGHAYRRIKSWVRAWVADWITINGKRHTIWKGSDEVNMKKLRDLPGQGRNDYKYVPGSNDDYGNEEAGDLTGTDLGIFATQADLQSMAEQLSSQLNSMNQQMNDLASQVGGSYDSGSGTITIPTDPSGNIDYADTTSGMTNFHQAKALGLANNSEGNYPEPLGTTKIGNDGFVYVLMIYSQTGKKHWYRKDFA